MRLTLWTLVLLVGSLVLGSLLALLTLQYGSVSDQYSKWRKRRETPHSEHYRKWLERNHLHQQRGGISSPQLVQEADYLRRSVRTLCLVVLNAHGQDVHTWPFMPNMYTSGQAIRDTWGRHCSKTLYFSNARDAGADDVTVLKSHDLDGWSATREIIRMLVSMGYLDKYDWFYKTHDDTFTVVENLLYYLAVYNASTPLYLGHAHTRWGSEYNSGGAAYVLSRLALRKVYSHLLKGHCRWGQLAEDTALGRCLAEVGVGVGDTRDTLGRARFLTLHPEALLIEGNLPWSESVWTHSKYLSPEGPECCSDYAISFHHITPNMMHVLHYLIYHLKPYGITTNLILPLSTDLEQNQTPASHNWRQASANQQEPSQTPARQSGPVAKQRAYPGLSGHTAHSSIHKPATQREQHQSQVDPSKNIHKSHNSYHKKNIIPNLQKENVNTNSQPDLHEDTS